MIAESEANEKNVAVDRVVMRDAEKEAKRQVRHPKEPAGFIGCITGSDRFEECSSYKRHIKLFGV